MALACWVRALWPWPKLRPLLLPLLLKPRPLLRLRPQHPHLLLRLKLLQPKLLQCLCPTKATPAG